MQLGPTRSLTAAFALFTPICAFAQAPDLRDFNKTVWEIALYGGVNATQVRLRSETSSYVSNGYNSFATGGGIAILMNPSVAFQFDTLYTGRVFGFGGSKGYFNCLQFPLTAHLRMGPVRVGGGVYGALWSEMGKIVRGTSSSEVTVNNLGNQSRELGFVVLAGFKTSIKNIPVRFEFRSFSSESDVAKSSTLTGSISEYQILAGYDFDMSSSRPFWNLQGPI